jgi:hypothetical protein
MKQRGLINFGVEIIIKRSFIRILNQLHTMHDKTVLTMETQISDLYSDATEVLWFKPCHISFWTLCFLCISIFDANHLVILKSTIFWDTTLCNLLTGKSSNQLARNFRSYRKQAGNGRVDLSSHWLAIRQNKAPGLLYGLSKPIGDKNRNSDGPKKWQFCWSKRKTGKKCNGVLGREWICQVSELQLCCGGWGSVGSRRKPGYQGWGWWVTGEGTFCVLIRAACTDQHGPSENHLLLCDRGFLWPFKGHQNSCSCLLLVRCGCVRAQWFHSVPRWANRNWGPLFHFPPSYIIWNYPPATCFHAGILPSLFNPVDLGDIFLRNVSWI